MAKFGMFGKEADPSSLSLPVKGELAMKVKSNVNLRSLLKPREHDLNKDDLKI